MEKGNSGIRFNIVIPAGTKANIYLPTNRSEITENGKTQAEGIKITEETTNHVRIKADPGKYRFVFPRNQQIKLYEK